MQLCYVDESGKAETLEKGDDQQQPVFVIAGISIPEDQLTMITLDWIELKRRFNPGMARRGQRGWLDGILLDLKGANLRRGFRARATGRQRKRAIGLIDGTVKLLERHDGRLIGRIWVKRLDEPNDAMKTYASSLQFICGAFHAGLPDDERGMVIVDSQTHKHNHQLAHSMFTQRFGRNPPYERLVDMPVFGHSDNHAGLQIADLLCSAVLAPIACSVYAGAYEGWNTHCDPRFLDVREEFGDRLLRLTYDWPNVKTGADSSSVVVNDPLGKRSTALMWGPRSPGKPKRRSSGKFSSPRPTPRRGRSRPGA
jgi:hypothetical protein